MNEHKGVYLSLDEMMQLEQSCRELSLLPKQPIRSFLHGSRASKVRGRGVSFEEIRQYTQGDDVRTIDWNVTARLQKPYVRVYTEERERPIILMIDQRQDMFFGSTLMMKSVAAASIAAHLGWMTNRAKDRVGAVVFNDEKFDLIPPRNSRQHIAQLFNVIESYNTALSAKDAAYTNLKILDEALMQVRTMVGHDALIILISDFAGMGDDSYRLIEELRAKNDVIAVPVYDAMLDNRPDHGELTVMHNDQMARFDLGNRRINEPLFNAMRERVINMKNRVNRLGVPAFSINTNRSITDQLREAFGFGGVQGGLGND